ncbi:Fic family protein [Legionella sp. CNM-4043-24]|uniref:Fic family protein n=1 Tax=Legionella sp. CNM-4043-24 TaxID=3421646 RepID=UPI00403B14ED
MFIDGNKQKSGRGVQLDTYIKPRPFCFGLFHFSPQEYTVKEYIERIEKIRYDKKYGYVGSQLLIMLYNFQWILTEEEYSQFTLLDLLKMDKGWIPFERNEAGYIRAMGLGFHAVCRTHEPLTVEFIKQLHKLATNNVENTAYNNKGEHDNNNGEFRLLSGVHYPLGKKNATEKGLLEFIRKIKKNHQDTGKNDLYLMEANFLAEFHYNGKCLALIENLSGKTELDELELCTLFKEFVIAGNEQRVEQFIPYIKKLLLATSESELAATFFSEICSNQSWWYQESNQPDETNRDLSRQMQELLEQYQEDIVATDEPLRKLQIIIRYIQSCEQLHPFADGNCRTFCILLLNHLLIRNGFPFVILNDPNTFDMFSESELLQNVLDGMKNTFTLLQTGALFHVSTDAILSALHSKPCFAPALAYFNDVVQAECIDRTRADNNPASLAPVFSSI